MKKTLSIVFVLLTMFALVACKEKTFEFSLDYNDSINVGEETIVVANDKDGVKLTNATITLKIESGSDVISTTNATIKGLKAGSAKVKVTVKDGDLTGDKEITITVTEIQTGIPNPSEGYYMRDASVIEEDGTRYLVYVTNPEAGEDEEVIAVRAGTKQNNDFSYGEEKVIITPSEDGWDKFIGSASITKGNFKLADEDYNYLIAYQGTKNANNTSFSIGLAVAKDVLGTWIKVGEQPLVEYDSVVYGESYAGFYGPSLVNLNKESIVRLFYTWADAYGHFTYFVDFDATDLLNIDLSGFSMVTNNGNLSSGENVTMVPNADFVYDAENSEFYMIKDYSPTPSRNPQVATRIELAVIDEEELYTAVEKNGWTSLKSYDMFDTPDALYERVYSGAIVSDEYGHLIDSDNIEIIYNVSDLEADNEDYIFSQILLTFNFTR